MLVLNCWFCFFSALLAGLHVEGKKGPGEKAQLSVLSQCLPPAVFLQYPVSFPGVSRLLQQQAALAVVPAHGCSSQGPYCHTRG